MTGHIKTWIEDKMYGFIKSDENGKEYFFHRDDLTYPSEHMNIKKGMLVNFTDKVTPKGPRASDITLGI